MDEKYDILKHPNIALTTDGGAEPYIHGEDILSIAAISMDTDAIKKSGAEYVGKEDYLFFSDDELEELIEKRKETQNEKQNN